jgi:zinc ribbon protein
MFCDRCGANIPDGQRFCSSCGKPAGIAVVPAGNGGRVARNLQLLGILWFVASVLNLIGAVTLWLVANLLFGHMGQIKDAWPFQNFLQGLLSTIAVFLFVKAIIGFATGWGLLQREAWARTAALVLGFIALLHIPFGTALGIYTIWVLLPGEADQEYRRLANAA